MTRLGRDCRTASMTSPPQLAPLPDGQSCYRPVWRLAFSRLDKSGTTNPNLADYTKKNPDLTVGLSTLNEVRSIVGTLPMVAIGGIDFANARETLAAGADAVAIISSLVAEPTQIEGNMSRMLLATKS